ncbi:hypothetical protein AGMMS49574_20850 [Bacteroidia bacterium]|nr:hypothetical protein AGMMS49574_20850 [Bacteroidia bacterium]
MINKERDTLDELFRSKLQNLEVDTMPEDWDAITSRLPKTKVIPLHRRWYYGAAVAVLLALFVGGGSYYLTRQPATVSSAIAQETDVAIPDSQDTVSGIILVSEDEDNAAPDGDAVRHVSTMNVATLATANIDRIATMDGRDVARRISDATLATTNVTISVETPIHSIDKQISKPVLIADAKPVFAGSKKSSASRKWGFGAGLGGLTEGSNSTVGTYLLRSSKMEDEHLLALNAVTYQNQGNMPKTNIKHKSPISFGFSVSRYLNDRFSIQTGLTYSLLRSSWETQGIYKNLTKQNLHFVGIPLSLSYKIAEWNRFMVYASTGVQANINVAGQERTESFSGDTQTGSQHTSVRMKEWQWSLNAHAGISYPLIRPLHVFAEIGAAYYFDNGSEMETVFSEKPFNLSPQFGFRLSF